MKKRYLVIICVFVCILSFSISPKVVLADEDNYSVYCRLCQHRDTDDPLYKKERQFYQKVKIIKDTYGDSVDTTALTFAVLHRYIGPDVAYEKEYDKNFNADEYRSRNNTLKTTYSSGDISNLSQEEIDLVSQNEKYDLLTLAAIVMVDSNKNGQYSDVCFMDGLSGNRLVRNDESNCEIGDSDDVFTKLRKSLSCGFDGFVNNYTCNMVALAGTDSYFGDSYDVKSATEKLRLANIKKVCENGYIGGLFNGVKNISNDERKTAQKKIIAQEIIDKSNYYRKRYGSSDATKGGSCPVGGINGSTKGSDLHGSRAERIKQIGPAAQTVYSQTGVFASVTIAQAIEETSIGAAYEGMGILENNNLFGIKCHSNYECRNGYASYSSIEEGIADHASVFNNGYYKGWDSATSPEEQIRIVGPTYCPVSDGCGDYAGRIISIINQYNLKEWDVKTNVSSSGSCPGTSSVSGFGIRTIVPTSSDSSFVEFEKSNGSGNRGQCVWYAKGRAFEIVNSLKDNNKLNENQAENIKKLILSIGGNGGDLYDNAKGKFNTSNDIKKPKAGSLIVWKKKGDYGHVAVVEEVNNESNTITVNGGYTSTGSCSNDWNCIKLEKKTMSLDEFYNSWGKNYNGGYEFDGYVYFLEPINDSSVSGLSYAPSTTSSSVSSDEGAKYGSSKEYECVNGKSVKKGSNCFGNVDVNTEEYQNRLKVLPNYYQGSGKAKDILVQGHAFSGVGCGTASLMAAYYMYTGDDFDVNKFVNDAVAQGYLSSSGSNSVMFYTPTGTKLITDNWGLYGERLERNIDSIISALSQGKKVLFNIYINHTTNWPTNYGHYILFDHYNKSTNQIYIFDPNGSAHRNGYFDVSKINNELLNNMNHDPVAISINGSDTAGSCGDAKTSDLSSVVSCAKSQLGKSYVWATHGPDTFDCSGLTYYCYKEALGVDISASSDAQWADLEHFTNVDSIDKLVPGDIIASRGGGHVSIYIGNGQVIHASSPGVGVIQSAASSHTGPILYKHYKGG